jgi:cell division inhibitor SepF
MGAMRKAGVWLGLIEEEDDAYSGGAYDQHGYDDEFADEPDDAPVGRSRLAAAERLAEARESSRATVRPILRSTTPGGAVAYPVRDNLALAPQAVGFDRGLQTVGDDERRYQITTLHPTTYNEARTIGEHFRDNVPVIINLSEMAEADAKRLVDFAAGLAFGLRGSMERVTNRVFLLSPANVQVTAEDKARIAEGGFFNQS